MPVTIARTASAATVARPAEPNATSLPGPPPAGLGLPVLRSPARTAASTVDVPTPTTGAPQRQDPGEIAVAGGIAQRDADGSVVFDPPPDEVAPVVHSSTEDRPVDLAAMADELYDRIERRLRSNLLLERERRGILADR
jgi:hypothetical protein